MEFWKETAASFLIAAGLVSTGFAVATMILARAHDIVAISWLIGSVIVLAAGCLWMWRINLRESRRNRQEDLKYGL
jgi:hypothetical protein